MVLAEPSSPLRRQPQIDDRQAASLDAIAFAANVVDVVYGRLSSTLLDHPTPVEAVFADAWSIIDWIYRLDGLVRNCRGLSSKSEPVLNFLNGSSLVESHRHTIQHAEGRYPDARDPRYPVDWISLYPADGEAEISLTGQHEALVRFIRRLETAVAASGPGIEGQILRIVSWPI